MGERLLQDALGNGFTVSSAGLGALVGKPADAHACDLMAAKGSPIEQHRARQINAALVKENDLILVMTQRQKQELESQYPSARGRVFRFCHWSGQDVADPYQQDRAAFVSALVLIEQGVADWQRRLT